MTNEPVVTSLFDAIDFVTARSYPRYAAWVERDDLSQELALYAYGGGKTELEKWLEQGDSFRIYRALFGAAKRYAETEKAAKSGYSFDDIAWYAPDKLAGLLPLALYGGWDGLTGASEHSEGSRQSSGREGGTLLAMVADVRAALKACPSARNVVKTMDEESEEYRDALVRLADWLGGEYPSAPGYDRQRRHALSNAAAVAATRSGY